MADLLDASVWLPLSDRGHMHSARARQYWAQETGRNVVFCRATAMALLRLLTQPAVMKTATMDASAAWHSLQVWLSLPAVEWAEEPAGLDEILRSWAVTLKLRGGDWTDAYLAAFSVASGHRLVSFDGGFRRFPGLTWLPLG